MSPHETTPRRHRAVVDKPLKCFPTEGIHTLAALLKHSITKFAESSIGTRQHPVTAQSSLHDEVPERDARVLSSGSPYSFRTYADFNRKVQALGSGFRLIGIQPEETIYMYGATSENWLACAHAASSHSIAFVTAYETLGIDGLSHSLRATDTRLIYVDQHLLPILSRALSAREATSLQIIICNPRDGISDNQEPQSFQTKHPEILFLTFEQVYGLGLLNPHKEHPPGPDTLCGIFYTSGSTGVPKGVPVTHRAVVAAVTGLDSILGRYIDHRDVYAAFLPLAHVLEFAFENACLFWGVKIGYSSPKTLFNNTVHGHLGDLRQLEPTFMIGAPAIWEKVRLQIHTHLNNLSDEERYVYEDNFAARKALLNSKSMHSNMGLLEAKVSLVAQSVVGTKLRFAMSGGGPIATSTQELISAVVAPLINGYGLSETMAMGGLMDPMKWSTEYLGQIPASIEMKLVDHLELGYTTTRDPPQGQIYVRGPSVLVHYFEPLEDDDGPTTNDGWFATGDIGEWVGDEHFKIIDRAKNIVKSLNGEYIALEKLESIYRSAALVSNICIYASPVRSKPIAIIIPEETTTREFRAVNTNNTTMSDSCSQEATDSSPPLRTAVMEQLRQIWSDAGLSRMEMVAGVIIAEEREWSPQNGMTTSVGKLSRRVIIARYQPQIDRLYDSS